MWRTYVRLALLDSDTGQRRRKEFEVRGTPVRIGRDAGHCHVALPHAGDVAPVHAAIDVDPDNAIHRVFVRAEDCELALLNGFPIYRPQPLHTRDVLSVGSCDFEFLDAGVVSFREPGRRISVCAPAAADLPATLRAESYAFIRRTLRPPAGVFEEPPPPPLSEAKAEPTPMAS
jgi:hypothetical protein